MKPTIIRVNGLFFVAYAVVDGIYFDALDNPLNANNDEFQEVEIIGLMKDAYGELI